MGDRCTVYMEFGGKISRQAAEALVKVLEAEGYRSNDTDDEPSIDILDHSFYCHDVNYANIEAIEDVCSEHAIDYRKENDAGGGYGAAIELWVGGVAKTFSCSEGEPCVPLSRVLEVETLACGLADLIAEARFAVEGLPELEIEP